MSSIKAMCFPARNTGGSSTSKVDETPEIAFCEDLRVVLELVSEDSGKPVTKIAFEIVGGRLRMIDDVSRPNLIMTLPEQMLAKIVHEDASWDELHIGYWGSYQRSPNVYTPGFWRLIQAPYYQRPLASSAVIRNSAVSGSPAVSSDSVVAELVESYGDQVSRIMRRYGLYCAGCHRSMYETLATAARQHGIDDGRAHDLVRELQEVCR